MKKKKTKKKEFPVEALIAGILLLIFFAGLLNMAFDKSFRRNTVETTAIVVDSRRSSGPGFFGHTPARSEIRFTIPDETEEIVAFIGGYHRVGREITIHYNPDNPTEVVRNRDVLFIVYSVICVCLLVFILYSVRKEKKSNHKSEKKRITHSKRKNKKRVICGANAIFGYLQQAIDMDIADYLVVSFEDETYTVGLSSDFVEPNGKRDKKTGKWENMFFYVDEQEFETFEHFKAGANLGGQPLAEIQGGIEVLEACGEAPHKFTIFENYVVE